MVLLTVYVQGGSNFVNETLVCDHSYGSYRAVLSRGSAYCVVQGGSNFVNETLVCDHSNGSYRAVLSRGSAYYAVDGSLML